MAYNGKNRLKRIIDIQEIYLFHREKGLINRKIYTEFIKPVYHISERCFYEYLATNAKRDLKILVENDKNQTKLFDEEKEEL